MKTIQIYDKPMCCSTGVCGPEVDPVLPRFAADLEWLRSQGHRVDRFNLAQQPLAFIENVLVHRLISTEGTNCLPLVLVDGTEVSRGTYPERSQFASWVDASPTKSVLPIASSVTACGPDGCC